MKIFLISGKAGHGKDTVATIMKEQLEQQDKKVLIIKFGDPVKWMASKFLNWDGKKDTTGRETLQWLGTEVMRTQYPTYWAEIIAKFIAACNQWDYVLIPDLRFQNEWDTIKEYNEDVTAIRVVRSNGQKPYINPNMTEEQCNHISETELDKCNFKWYISNSGTYDNLVENVKSMLWLLDDNIVMEGE